nr:V-type ATP synthase subunit B [Candidatus Krumholzibacteriota bacterium]
MKEKNLTGGREYIGISQVSGPLIAIKGIHNVGYNELAEIVDPTGKIRLGMILESSEGAAVIQVFEGTSGLSIPETRVRFSGEPLRFGVSEEIMGRVFNGLGQPIDGGPPPRAEMMMDVNGLPINPTARDYPKKFIQTGISAIDGMNTLVRGQKLPIFSGTGMPHNRIVAQITRQATIVGEDTSFAVVFAAMG